MRRFYYFLIVLSTLLIIFLSFISLGDNIIQTSYQTYKSNQIDFLKIKNLTSNYLNLYSNILKCNLNYTHKWTPSLTIDQYDPSTIDYTQVVSESTHDYRINRAIVIYYPIEISSTYEPEFKWFYQSWLEMQKYEPEKWRTDIILYINSYAADSSVMKFFESLNCTFGNKRLSRFNVPMCRLINYVPLKDRLFDKGLNKFDADDESANLYQHLYHKVNIFSTNVDELRQFYVNLKEKLSQYGYLDSILVAFDGYNDLKDTYDFLIRSDMVSLLLEVLFIRSFFIFRMFF
jgi:hypothetical protein